MRTIAEKQSFTKAYVAAFLGSYAAQTYDRQCQLGWKDKTQPVEDALHLAEEAWNQIGNV